MRRPPARTLDTGPSRGRPSRAGTAFYVAAIAAVATALALATPGAGAFWLSIPCALLAASLPAAAPAGALAAGSVILAAATALAARPTAALPSPLLVALVPGASVAVLLSSLQRLARERDRMRGVALTDPLTGVANRRQLLARADYEISRHTRERRRFALVMLDLDGFKRLNDRFGHAAGDEILRDVAASLTQALRAQDTVARLGGDEFCVLAPDTDAEGAPALTARIAAAAAAATDGISGLGASLGVALFPDDGRATEELLEAADQRLLGSKRALYGGRGRRRGRVAA